VAIVSGHVGGWLKGQAKVHVTTVFTRKRVLAKPATRFCRGSQFSSKRVCIHTALHAFLRFHEFFSVRLLKI